MYRYDNYTDSFVRIDGEPNTGSTTVRVGVPLKEAVIIEKVELTDECIDKIADAVVQKFADRKTEPQTDIHDLTDCDFCKDRNCKDCEGGKDEPQIIDWGKRKPCTLELFDDDGNYIEPKDKPQTENPCDGCVCDDGKHLMYCMNCKGIAWKTEPPKIEDEPQTDCAWQNDEHIPTELASTMLKNRFKE